MAQTGFTPIQLYSSSTAAAVPIAGNLAAGELAINTVDEKLYFKNSAGAVKLLAANITPVANGGSGATTASAARTNFGATTLGGNLFTITNPSAVTFPRFNADNTVSSLNAADFRTAIGAGSGGGSVTSVAGTGTVNGITLTGTVTSSGSLTLGGTLSGVSLTTQVSGTLPIANGGTGTTSTTFANLTTNVTGILPIANGGTGNANGTVAKLQTTNFSVQEAGGKLVFYYGATAIASMDSSGNFTSLSNVTAYGTP